jgi:DNA-binding beta-propeller fold protein YncE
VDGDGGRLFIAALGNDSLEVVDTRKGERVKSVGGLKEPQGVAFVPASNLVLVACGGDGSVRAFDADTLEARGRLEVGDDADNARFAPATGQVLVGHSSGALAIIDAATMRVAASVKLPGHPESFQIEPSGARAFVNFPGGVLGGGGEVAVVDLVKHEVAAHWKLEQAGRNFPMALDGAGGRLFVGCRRPAMLIVLDTQTGRTLAKSECVGDADDVFFDARSGCAMVIGGDGAIDVFRALEHTECTRITTVQTASGARTGLFDADRSVLYVAVPKHSGQNAEVRVYTWTPPVTGTEPKQSGGSSDGVPGASPPGK